MFTAPATSPLDAGDCHGVAAGDFAGQVVVYGPAKTGCGDKERPGAIASPSGFQESTRPPTTIKVMPAAMRRSKFSRKTNQAKSAVKTASRLSSNALTDAGVETRPSISNTGAEHAAEQNGPRQPAEVWTAWPCQRRRCVAISRKTTNQQAERERRDPSRRTADRQARPAESPRPASWRSACWRRTMPRRPGAQDSLANAHSRIYIFLTTATSWRAPCLTFVAAGTRVNPLGATGRTRPFRAPASLNAAPSARHRWTAHRRRRTAD